MIIKIQSASCSPSSSKTVSNLNEIIWANKEFRKVKGHSEIFQTMISILIRILNIIYLKK